MPKSLGLDKSTVKPFSFFKTRAAAERKKNSCHCFLH